jgi:hypothetical protein
MNNVCILLEPASLLARSRLQAYWLYASREEHQNADVIHWQTPVLKFKDSKGKR